MVPWTHSEVDENPWSLTRLNETGPRHSSPPRRLRAGAGAVDSRISPARLPGHPARGARRRADHSCRPRLRVADPGCDPGAIFSLRARLRPAIPRTRRRPASVRVSSELPRAQPAAGPARCRARTQAGPGCPCECVCGGGGIRWRRRVPPIRIRRRRRAGDTEIETLQKCLQFVCTESL